MKTLGLFLAAFGSSYFALERTGLTSLATPSNVDVLHSTPVLIYSIIILLYFIVAVSIMEKRKRIPIGWIWLTAVTLIVAGLWTSYFTRYDATLIITEGQSIDIPGVRKSTEKTLRGRYAVRLPLNVTLEKLAPEFNEQKTDVKGLRGKIVVRDERGNTSSERIIGDIFPQLIDGYWMKFSSFGYSPGYVLKTRQGEVLDSAFVYMDIFPPGKEDYFRLLSPVTFHLRFFSNKEGGKQEHPIKLRIVRNKEILLNKKIALGDEVPFENGIISFPEVRMWSRLSVVRDMGLLPAALGALIMFFYLIIYALRRKSGVKAAGCSTPSHSGFTKMLKM